MLRQYLHLDHSLDSIEVTFFSYPVTQATKREVVCFCLQFVV
jgi:hypothetical protein